MNDDQIRALAQSNFFLMLPDCINQTVASQKKSRAEIFLFVLLTQILSLMETFWSLTQTVFYER